MAAIERKKEEKEGKDRKKEEGRQKQTSVGEDVEKLEPCALVVGI